MRRLAGGWDGQKIIAAMPLLSCLIPCHYGCDGTAQCGSLSLAPGVWPQM